MNTHETPVFFHEISKINAQKIKLDAFGALKTIFEASLYPWLKAQKKSAQKYQFQGTFWMIIRHAESTRV